MLSVLLAMSMPAAAEPPRPAPAAELIPREVLFSNPERAALQISPDGTKLAWLAPRNGVLNVYVADTESPEDATAVTRDQGRGIMSFFWTYANDIVYMQDEAGDENFRLYRVSPDGSDRLALTPESGVRAQPVAFSPAHPNAALISLNERNPALFDVYRVDLETGERERVLENNGFIGFTADDDLRLRFASAYRPDGGITIYRLGQGDPQPYAQVPMQDALTTGIVGFDRSGENLYIFDSRDRDTSALFSIDADTGERELLHSDARADVSGVITDPTTGRPIAAAATYAVAEWTGLTSEGDKLLARLRALDDGAYTVTSTTLDGRRLTVAYTTPDGPVRYYLVDRDSDESVMLFTNRPALESYTLAEMHPVVIKSRDGLNLVSYLTLPPGRAEERDDQLSADQPLPMVLLVHGGPWARDQFGYNSMHQWLANRGYAVLSVNFRGSTGFGKAFLNAGNMEWAGKMHDDLLDAVNWAVERNIADPDRVAIMGGSYGGYAALVGLTFTPDVFAAGVSIVGPSNLVTLLESIPPYWGPVRAQFDMRMGSIDTPEGRSLLEAKSPLNRVDAISRPLLIGQGANDPRVKQAESDQIVAAMQSREIPVTYALFPDEGHGFARPENRLAFYAVTEAFLAEVIGGRVEPFGDDLQGSSIQIPAGRDGVEGLSQALPADEKRNP